MFGLILLEFETVSGCDCLCNVNGILKFIKAVAVTSVAVSTFYAFGDTLTLATAADQRYQAQQG